MIKNSEYYQLIETSTIEECSELIKAITKYQKYKEQNNTNDLPKFLRQNLISEIADVELCIAKLKTYYNISSDEVVEELQYKNERGLQIVK